MKTTKILKGLAFLSALTLVFTFGSCKKEDDSIDLGGGGGGGAPVSKTGLITSSGWVMKTAVLSVTGQPDFDIMVFFDECSKDDIITFKTDFSMLYDQGAVKCNQGDPQTESGGTWSFSNNETELIIEDDGDMQYFDIITLTSTELKIAQNEYDSTAMADRTTTIGFKHQ